MDKIEYYGYAFNRLYGKYKYRAKKKAIGFRLTKIQFREITQQKCFYCGIQPLQVISAKGKTDKYYIYNGVDRIDNDGIYAIENCVACCGVCNKMKNSYTFEHFMEHIKKIIANMEERNKNECLCIG